MKRGEITLRKSDLTEYTTYRADVAQRIHKENVSNKGRDLKIGNDYAFVAHVENKIINEKFSPYAILQEIKSSGLEFKTDICVTTLYNYIHAGLFMNIKMEHMPSPRKSHKSHVKVKRRAYNRLKGKTIEERPADVKSREEFGHWEMDTVYSQQTKKATLLVLTERKGRGECIIKMKSRTESEVKRALDRLERTLTPKCFREIFKTITCDNGSEFADPSLIEKSCINKKIPRTAFITVIHTAAGSVAPTKTITGLSGVG